MRRALHAEWTKFRTVRARPLALLGAVLATVLIGLLGTASRGGGAAPAPPLGPGGEAVSDGFTFVHRTLDGDGSITVRVRSLTGEIAETPTRTVPGLASWSKAGIIVKEGLTSGSRYAALMLTGAHGVRMQHDFTQDTAAPGSSPDAQPWLRLVRAGDLITGYVSADGAAWTEVGTATLRGAPTTLQAGLFVATPAAAQNTGTGIGFAPAAATAAFGPVELHGGWPSGAGAGGWTGGQLGDAGGYPPGVRAGYTSAASGFTLSGAGDIAPLTGGQATAGGIGVERFLVGSFAGILVLLVLGTLTTAGEYRSGLIRTTLAANPRRGRVLAAKACLLGVTGFAAGTIAAAVVLPIGMQGARSSGFVLFPVAWTTELRLVVGTGLLFAVAGVLGVALGAVLRRGATTVAVLVVALVLPYLLAVSSALPAGPAQWLLRLTPAAGFAIQQTLPQYLQVLDVYTPANGYFPLTPWLGLAVLCGYAVTALGLAWALLRRRDV
ncbi:ABC-type transport system involved in multi-copper enzyme maturation permease subunit [Streptacidiphilus sp. MAP12-20]|uniref:ABC transporter permease subunit n=1 Tax=Streptacidiphilus sp. MAP12-20 TaxID=3156299 RepID=UPI00351895B8